MTNRATSIYTLRHETAEANESTHFALITQGIRIQDHGETSVSFRAVDDAEAADIARQVPAWSGNAVELTTGLGIHRREVSVCCPSCTSDRRDLRLTPYAHPTTSCFDPWHEESRDD